MKVGMKKGRRPNETPEDAALRRSKDRERTRSRRAKLKEHLSPDALAVIRAKNYETALRKRYKNDDQLYQGPDAIPGETVGDRRRRLEAQRVRVRRKLRKITQIQDKPQNPVDPNQNPSIVQEKMKQKLSKRIAASIQTSIQTPEERGLINDLKKGDKVTVTRSPSEEEDCAWKRFFLAKLEADFTEEKKNLAATAIELELGTTPISTTPLHDGIEDFVVKIEPDQVQEEEDQESVQDWMARMYSSDFDEAGKPASSDDDSDDPTLNLLQVQERQEQISLLKAACAQKHRVKELSRLQSLVETTRRAWAESAPFPEDDAIRAALDKEREIMRQRIYTDKRRLIATITAQLAEKRVKYSCESEEQRKFRIQAALEQESRVPKCKQTTPTSKRDKTPKFSPRLPLDDSAKATMAEKSRIRNKLRRAGYRLFTSLIDIFTSYPPETEELDGDQPPGAALTEFETLLTSGDNPRVIQFWALVRVTKDKYPEDVSTYRRLLYDLLATRMKGLLARPSHSRRRVDTTPILPLYKKLYPEEETTTEPRFPEIIPVSKEQSRTDFMALKEFIQKCDESKEVAPGAGLGLHLRPKRNIEGKWDRIKSDPARHEHFKALKRRWHQRKKNGIELELGTYLTVATGKGRRMINSKTEAGKASTTEKAAASDSVSTAKPTRTRKIRSDAGKKKKKNLAALAEYEQLGQPYFSAPQQGPGGQNNQIYSDSNSAQKQNQELDDNDYEFGWLPMGSGVSGVNGPPNNPNQQQLIHGSNYFHLQPQQSSSSQGNKQNASTNHTPISYQQSSSTAGYFPSDQQRLGWNLSNHSIHSQSQIIQNQNSHFGWNPPALAAYSQPEAMPAPPPWNPGHSPNDSSDSQETSCTPPPNSTTPKICRARGRPRKGEETKKIKIIRKRKWAPVLLAAEALPPPLHRLDLDGKERSEITNLMDPTIINSILPKCPHCQDVLIGPVELEKHVKKMHPKSGEQSNLVKDKQSSLIFEKDNNGAPPLNNEIVYRCKSCSSPFKNPFSLISHIFLTHYPGKEYSCPIGRRLGSKSKSSGGRRRCAKGDVRYERHGLRVHLPLVHPEEIRGTWIMGINTIRVVDKASRFLCLQCDETTSTYAELASHYTAAHDRIRYGCESCGIYFREDDLLRDHVQLFHPEKLCPPSCPTPVNLNQKVEIFPCSICDSEFASLAFLRAHTATGHCFFNEDKSKASEEVRSLISKPQKEGEDKSNGGYAAAPYKCEICPRSYLSLGSLRLHSIRRHKLYKLLKNMVLEKGSEPGSRFSGATSQSNEDESITPPVATLPKSPADSTTPKNCHLCPYSAPCDTFHSLHLGYDAYLKTFCTLCSKTFPSSSSLLLHSQSDHGLDPTAARNSIPLPSGKLGGIRPKGVYPEQWLSCGVCCRGFTHPEYHSIHTIFQQGLGGAVGCKSCPNVYPSRYLLRKHVKDEHEATFKGRKSSVQLQPNVPRPLLDSDFEKLIISTEVGARTLFTCKVCLKSYKTEEFVHTHISETHKDDAFTRVFCSRCNSTFSCRDNLRKHEKVAHSDVQTRFSCPSCPAVFQRMHNVKKHFKGEHPGQTFSVKDVTRSLAPEEEETDGDGTGSKLSCNICSAKFTTKVSMKRHVTQQHFSIHINTFCEGCGLQLHPSLMASHAKKCKNVNSAPPETSALISKKSSVYNSKSVDKRQSIHELLGQVQQLYEQMEELGGIHKFSQNPTRTKSKSKKKSPSRGGRLSLKLPRPRGRPRRQKPLLAPESESETDTETEDSQEPWCSSDDGNISKLSINHVARKTRSSCKPVESNQEIHSSASPRESGESFLEEEWDWNDMIIKQENSDVSENSDEDFQAMILPDDDQEDNDKDLVKNPLLLWSDSESSEEL